MINLYVSTVSPSRPAWIYYNPETSGITQGQSCLNISSVKSWRTGPRARAVTAIPRPREGRTLQETLRNRVEWMRRVERNFQGDGGSGSRRMSVDTGHEFTSAKGMLMAPTATIHRQSTGVLRLQAPVVTTDVILAPAWVSRFPEGRLGSISGTTLPAYTQVQYDSNNRFASMAPSNPGASLGVTILELVRGDIPSVVRNIERMVIDAKHIHKHLGSEYLNQVFGWTPIVREIEGVINTLTGADAYLYSGSTRRFRSWTGASGHSQRESSGSGGAGSAFTQDQVTLSAGLNLPLTETVDWSLDYRISSRFANRARPTIAANRFVEQANDVVGRLGFWTPDMGWELLPYSWLVDWAVNIGSSIENASYYGGSDPRHKTEYAYLTSYTRYSKSWDFKTLSRVNGTTASNRTISAVTHPRAYGATICKDRRRISPFGLGINLNGLSASQFATLTALGLARSPF